MTDVEQVIKDLSNGDLYTVEEISKITHKPIEFVRGVLNDPSVHFSSNLDGSGCLYIMDIKYDTIVDGDGFRNSVYCAGCNVYCEGCHNPQSWFITNGRPMSVNELIKALSESEYDVTFTGGEASVQAKVVGHLAHILKDTYRKNIWLYSGHTFEDLMKDITKQYLLENIDVLVDGKFLQKFKQPNLVFKGSSNQRIIDVQESLRCNKIILHNEYR